VLNRLAFGPSPSDLADVHRMGVHNWIEMQLNPETIDDSAVQAKLANLNEITWTNQQLMTAYQDDQARQKKRQQEAREAALAAQGNAASTSTATSADVASRTPRNLAIAAADNQMSPDGNLPGTSYEAVGQLEAAKVLRAVESRRQLQEVLVDFWSNHFNLDVRKNLVRDLKVADERDVIRPHVLGKFRDLLEASAKSPAMLVYLDNALSIGNNSRVTPRMMAIARQRAAALQTQPGAAGANAQAFLAKTAGGKKASGLNENYGREIMELHTLGVDGGYTQKDVTECARCFTGWSIDRQTGEFKFYPLRHDDGEKVVLGHIIPAGGGMEDGETVLDILSASPATAHHLSYELCERFVSDNPPPSLVAKAAQTYLKTDGDLRQVLRTIFESPEFYSPSVYQSKYKSPFEYAVSCVRALGGTFQAPDPNDRRGRLRLLADAAASSARKGVRYGRNQSSSIVDSIADMGQPLFAYEAPTGYPENSQLWISSGSLLARFNYAVGLADGKVAEVAVQPSLLVQNVATGDRTAMLHDLAADILGGEMSAHTRAALLGEMPAGEPVDPTKLAGLLLGSPEFQKR
jgi:uncharacterized protein (DUF1800 family)